MCIILASLNLDKSNAASFLLSSAELMKSTISAFLAVIFDLLTPSFSILFLASLMPAVSYIVTGTPSRFRRASIVSLVVPACADTIARSSFSKVFIRLDFPTFGAPIKAIFSPLLSLSPVIPFSRSFSIFFINKDVFLVKLFFCAF